MDRTELNVTELAQKVAGAFPDLDSRAQGVAVATYRLLAKGEPVSADAVARQLSLQPEEVRERLDSWPDVCLDANKMAIGSARTWGISAAARRRARLSSRFSSSQRISYRKRRSEC